MGCWGRNRGRLLCMLMLTFMFMVLEVVVSRVTSSLAMLSDSFHMLSDVLALVVALVAERFARRTHATQKNTFGWIRAEVMGALVNAIFLTGLCFAILLEAIERFIEPHEMQQPLVVLAVGVAGLVVNVLGLCLFHHHSGFGNDSGHAHGGHGHSHGFPKGVRGKSSRLGVSDHIVSPGEQRSDQEETNTLVTDSSNANGLKVDGPGKERHSPPQVVRFGGWGVPRPSPGSGRMARTPPGAQVDLRPAAAFPLPPGSAPAGCRWDPIEPERQRVEGAAGDVGVGCAPERGNGVGK